MKVECSHFNDYKVKINKIQLNEKMKTSSTSYEEKN